MLFVGCWLWGEKYGPEYVSRLASAVKRNLKIDHRFRVWRPVAEDECLTKIPGCFARLRTFDPAWQAEQGIEPGDQIAVLDLDMVITGALDDLFDRPSPFSILQGVNASNPCRYNGSLWTLDAGYRPDVCGAFSLDRAEAVKTYTIADDQRWMEYILPDADAFGPSCGVYGFKKPGWPQGDELPANARAVSFFGSKDPAQFTHLPWVKRHWLA